MFFITMPINYYFVKNLFECGLFLICLIIFNTIIGVSYSFGIEEFNKFVKKKSIF